MRGRLSEQEIQIKNELILLLQSKNLSAFNKNRKLVHFEQQDYPQQINLNKKMRLALASVLAGTAPIDLYWALISLFSLGSTLIPLAVIFGTITVLVFISTIYFRNKKLNSETEKNNSLVEFYSLMLQAAEYLRKLLRKENGVDKHVRRKKLNPSKIVPHIEDPQITNQEDVQGPSLSGYAFSYGVSSIFLCMTYFWGIAEIVTTLGIFAGASALLITPMGLGIACGIFLGIGLYMAYRRYQAEVGKQFMEQKISDLRNSINLTLDQCNDLQVEQNSLQHSSESKEKQTAAPVRQVLEEKVVSTPIPLPKKKLQDRGFAGTSFTMYPSASLRRTRSEPITKVEKRGYVSRHQS